MTVKTTPAVVRVAARDRRIVTFTLNNTLDEPVSGSLQFDLPAGVAVKPEKRDHLDRSSRGHQQQSA